ncbi:adhesion G protein-coupled receptor L4-like [Amphiura filiformis]|uniref:adhesion G protein-coupled receptor L4-like n=1 Tax=Amphiura filiformis TaxID=82378 RepID=UPI003B219B13
MVSSLIVSILLSIFLKSANCTTLTTTTNPPNDAGQFEDNLESTIEDIIANGSNSDASNVLVAEVIVNGEKTITLEENAVILRTSSEVEVVVAHFTEAVDALTDIQYENTPASETRMVSKIISIDMFTANRSEEITTLDEPITIVNSIIKPEIPTDLTWYVQPRCSSWDTQNRYWTDEGCALMSLNGTHLECECNHLTIFAVLIQFTEYPLTSVDVRALDMLTYLGSSLSIVSLAVTLAIYIYCKLYKSHRILIHMNQSLALLISHLIFVTGIELNGNVGFLGI